MDEDKIFVRLMLGGIGLVIFIFTVFATIEIVDATERGVTVRLGEVTGYLEPGFHIVAPFITKVKSVDVSTQKVELEVSAASKDLQDVFTTVAIQYNIEPTTVDSMWKEYRGDVVSRELAPAIQDSIKAVTARFNASELITDRAAVKESINEQLKKSTEGRYINVTGVSIVNFRFSEQFARAIEEKVTAEQNAQKAANDLKRVEFEAQQQIERAKAEAESIRIQAQAVTQLSIKHI